LKVNSRHHQAIKTLGEGFKIAATHNSLTNHVEAIVHDRYPIFAVQFHPEDLYETKTLEWVLENINKILKR